MSLCVFLCLLTNKMVPCLILYFSLNDIAKWFNWNHYGWFAQRKRTKDRRLRKVKRPKRWNRREEGLGIRWFTTWLWKGRWLRVVFSEIVCLRCHSIAKKLIQNIFLVFIKTIYMVCFDRLLLLYHCTACV